MSGITVITAFFDIGRGESSVLKRTNEQYFNYFQFWARMKNRVICYTSPELVDKVIEIRRGFGLAENTEVVPIDDVYALEPEIYKNCEKVSADKRFRSSRLVYNALSNTARYSYITFMEYWFLQDAQSRFGLDGQVAWLDFGFNHGGEIYPYPEDFDFLWESDLPPQKIHIFALNKNYMKPIHQILRSLEDSMQGSIIILNAELCPAFYLMTKKAFESILSIGQLDDDQLVLCLAWQNNPDLYAIHHTYWHLGLKEHAVGGGQDLRVKPGYGQKTLKWFVNYWRIRLRYDRMKAGFLFRFIKELISMPTPANHDETGGKHD